MPEHADVLVGFVTFLLVIVTVASIVATWKIAKSQEALQTRLAKDQHDLQDRISKDQIALQNRISKDQTELQDRISAETEARYAEQRRYEQRTQLLPMWRYLSTLDEIAPKDPNDPKSGSPEPQVIKTVNTLELVAVCTEAEIIDETIVLRTFRDRFIELFEAVRDYGTLDGYGPNKKVTGQSLLSASPAASQFYKKLIDERDNRDKPQPLKGKS